MKLKCICKCMGHLGYMMPLFKQNLYQLIPALNDSQLALKIAIDVAKGLEYLHQSNILHRDLKPQNILVNCFSFDFTFQIASTDVSSEVVGVISDFGLARLNTATKTPFAQGTEGFIAPEILDEKPYSEKADVSSKPYFLDDNLDIQLLHSVVDFEVSQKRDQGYI